MRHFDSHAYRTEDYDGVRDFARGSMRTYLILKDKARRWNEDAEIQTLLAEINEQVPGTPATGQFDKERHALLDAHAFDRRRLAEKRLPYERLDQLTLEILLGVR